MHARSTPASEPTPSPRWRFVGPVPEVEVFREPSPDVERAFRRVPQLFLPEGPPPVQALRNVMVTPYAQLAPHDFDLQLYLVDVFHMRPFTYASHVVGMLLVNTVLGAVFAELLGVWAALAWAGLLALWYARTAIRTGLYGWGLALVPQLCFIGLAGAWLTATLDGPGLFLAWLCSAWLVACGHLLEWLPPRAGDPLRWQPIPEFVFGPADARHDPLTVLTRVLRLTPGPFIGLFNETVSTPRLMPMFTLRILFSLGYRPDLRARFDDWRDRAWESGNPALDYIGIGGGAALALVDPADG